MGYATIDTKGLFSVPFRIMVDSEIILPNTAVSYFVSHENVSMILFLPSLRRL